MATASVTFQVLEGIDRGRIYRDIPIPVSIGREEGNSLRLNDERVSRFHAKVQVDGDDYILTDLDSTNGTHVNGTRISGFTPLAPGDEVSLGSEPLQVRRRTPSALTVKVDVDGDKRVGDRLPKK